jgi:hypothetical protein
MDNPEKLATLGNKTQDEDKQNKKHNTKTKELNYFPKTHIFSRN